MIIYKKIKIAQSFLINFSKRKLAKSILKINKQDNLTMFDLKLAQTVLLVWILHISPHLLL